MRTMSATAPVETLSALQGEEGASAGERVRGAVGRERCFATSPSPSLRDGSLPSPPGAERDIIAATGGQRP
jgi:hypothetical protein